MRELLGTIVLVLVLISVLGVTDLNLCLHTGEKDFCTQKFKPRAASQPQGEPKPWHTSAE